MRHPAHCPKRKISSVLIQGPILCMCGVKFLHDDKKYQMWPDRKTWHQLMFSCHSVSCVRWWLQQTGMAFCCCTEKRDAGHSPVFGMQQKVWCARYKWHTLPKHATCSTHHRPSVFGVQLSHRREQSSDGEPLWPICSLQWFVTFLVLPSVHMDPRPTGTERSIWYQSHTKFQVENESKVSRFEVSHVAAEVN